MPWLGTWEESVMLLTLYRVLLLTCPLISLLVECRVPRVSVVPCGFPACCTWLAWLLLHCCGCCWRCLRSVGTEMFCVRCWIICSPSMIRSCRGLVVVVFLQILWYTFWKHDQLSHKHLTRESPYTRSTNIRGNAAYPEFPRGACMRRNLMFKSFHRCLDELATFPKCIS